MRCLPVQRVLPTTHQVSWFTLLSVCACLHAEAWSVPLWLLCLVALPTMSVAFLMQVLCAQMTRQPAPQVRASAVTSTVCAVRNGDGGS